MGCLLGFIQHWSAAIEASATVMLVIAALFQWHTMRAQVKQERDRWQREDEIRAEEKRPKAAFWLEPSADKGSPELWCANVGMVNFIVSGMQVSPLAGASKNIQFSRKDCLVVPVGEMRSKKLISPEEMFGSDRPGNAEIELIFQGPTDAKAYHLWFHDGMYIMKNPEGKFQGLIPLYCKNCEKRWHISEVTAWILKTNT